MKTGSTSECGPAQGATFIAHSPPRAQGDNAVALRIGGDPQERDMNENKFVPGVQERLIRVTTS